MPNTVEEVDVDLVAMPAPKTPLREFWDHFSHNKGAVVGLIFIVSIFLVSICAGWIAPHDPIAQARDSLLLPPAWVDGGNWNFILGTDDVGRDILSRLILERVYHFSSVY